MSIDKKKTGNEGKAASSVVDVLYNGRNVARTERLRQMREAQKKLRERRQKEIDNIERENSILKDELAKLKEQNSRLLDLVRNDIHELRSSDSFIFFPSNITANELSRAKEKASSKLSYILSYDPKVIQDFILDGRCIIGNIAEKTLTWIKSELSLNGKERLIETAFKFVPPSENGLIERYIREIEELLIQRTLPVRWVPADYFLPRGTVSAIGLVEYLLKYCNIRELNLGILTSYVAKHTFATMWGPAIFFNDLVKCVAIAQDVAYDEQYLLENTEVRVCAMGV